MAATRYRIAVHAEPRYARFVRARALAALCRRALARERASACDVSVMVTDDTVVRSLNRRFAGRDEATDVLSFELVDTRFPHPGGRRRALGEIVISYPTAARQAREAHHSTHDELSHLVVQEAVHLLGYDHRRPVQERPMRAREEAILGWPAHQDVM